MLIKMALVELISTDEFKEKLKSIEPFDAATIKPWLYEISEKQSLNPNHVMMALRYKVTGSRVGAGVAETIELLGKDTVMERLNQI
jgi:glutamyl/glutaminyl-tRNA synthetase